MDTWVMVLAAAVLLLYFKWIMIVVTLPFMAAYAKYHNTRSKVWKLLAVPAWALEKVMRGGWERYVLFQVAEVPSLHARKTVYKALGAHISERVVFHFGTELRAPYGLKIGGVQS